MLANANLPHIINYDHSANEFILVAKEFSETIVAIIKADFATFISPSNVKHPTPVVQTPPGYLLTQNLGGNYQGPSPPATGVTP